jgi:hypothetical protein
MRPPDFPWRPWRLGGEFWELLAVPHPCRAGFWCLKLPRMSTRQFVDQASLVAQRGSRLVYPERGNPILGKHPTGARVAFDRQIFRVTAPLWENIAVEKMFLDRRWVAPTARRETCGVRTPSGFLFDALKSSLKPAIRPGRNQNHRVGPHKLHQPLPVSFISEPLLHSGGSGAMLG